MDELPNKRAKHGGSNIALTIFVMEGGNHLCPPVLTTSDFSRCHQLANNGEARVFVVKPDNIT